MICARCQEILSAELDGEAGAADVAAARRHAAACETCTAFLTGATALHRAVRLGPAAPVPDLTAAILAATAPAEPTTRRGAALRLALGAVAITLLAIAIPALLAPNTGHEHPNHFGAIDLALAVGLAFVAAYPRRALAGFLPVATVLVAVCFGLALADVTGGHGETLRLVNHVVGVVGVALAWCAGLDERHALRSMRLAA